MPRIKSSRNKRDGRWKREAEDKILEKRTGQEWKRDAEDKSSRNKRDERGGKMYNCCSVILM